jgi:hypothetical protein
MSSPEDSAKAPGFTQETRLPQDDPEAMFRSERPLEAELSDLRPLEDVMADLQALDEAGLLD